MTMAMAMAIAMAMAKAMAITQRTELCRRPRVLPRWLAERVCGRLCALRAQAVQDIEIGEEEAIACRDNINVIDPWAHGPMAP